MIILEVWGLEKKKNVPEWRTKCTSTYRTLYTILMREQHINDQQQRNRNKKIKNNVTDRIELTVGRLNATRMQHTFPQYVTTP